MKKLQEIDRLVEEALNQLGIKFPRPKEKQILTSLARKCAEINSEDFPHFSNTPITNYNSRLREGRVEEVKKEEKPELQPLPSEVPDWFMPTGRDYRVDTWKKVIQHFGTPHEIKKLKEELETERISHAGCGVAALGYFDGCAPKYLSASLQDVISLRKKYEELLNNQQPRE